MVASKTVVIPFNTPNLTRNLAQFTPTTSKECAKAASMSIQLKGCNQTQSPKYSLLECYHIVITIDRTIMLPFLEQFMIRD